MIAPDKTMVAVTWKDADDCSYRQCGFLLERSASSITIASTRGVTDYLDVVEIEMDDTVQVENLVPVTT